MKHNLINEKSIIAFILILIALIYILFPTNNSSIDAYYYAACIKYGKELFLPHHLLYNGFGYAIYKLMMGLGFPIDVLTLMKAVNAICTCGCLLLLYFLLKELNLKSSMLFPSIIIVAFSFSVFRFATENENYIFPILFSLAGSMFFLKFIRYSTKSSLLLSGLFVSIACLFHQIHFFWWLGLLIGILIHYRKSANIIIFIIPALIIPLTYLLVIKYYYHNTLSISGITGFAFEDFYQGKVDTRVGFANLYLTCINFFRTFFQVHGIQKILISKSLFYIIPALIMIFLVAFIFLKRRKITFIRPTLNNNFINIHILIFTLQLLFAFYSVGNAEFMVMLPFITIICIIPLINIDVKLLWLLGLTLLIWNFTYGIYPNNKYDYNGTDIIAQKVISDKNSYFVINDKPLILYVLYYNFGKDATKNILPSPYELTDSMSLYELKTKIDNLLRENIKVYTNCINRIWIMNRASIMFAHNNNDFFNSFETTRLDSYDTFYGTYYFTQLNKKVSLKKVL